MHFVLFSDNDSHKDGSMSHYLKYDFIRFFGALLSDKANHKA